MCVCVSDPEFVSSAFIEQSASSNPTGEDDKIYFFFTEVAKEYDLYTKVKVPRVARVCKVGPLKSSFSGIIQCVHCRAQSVCVCLFSPMSAG